MLDRQPHLPLLWASFHLTLRAEMDYYKLLFTSTSHLKQLIAPECVEGETGCSDQVTDPQGRLLEYAELAANSGGIGAFLTDLPAGLDEDEPRAWLCAMGQDPLGFLNLAVQMVRAMMDAFAVDYTNILANLLPLMHVRTPSQSYCPSMSCCNVSSDLLLLSWVVL